MAEVKKSHILYLLTSVVFLLCSASDIYIPSLPRIVQEFHTTPNVVNLIISFYSFGAAFFILLADFFIIKYGRRPITLFCIGICSFCSLLISISPWIWGIIILRIIQSIGLGFNIIVGSLIIKDIMGEREQIKAMGIILSGLVISPAISPVIGAYLAHYFGWRSCFLFNGALGTIIFIFAYKILPETCSKKFTKLPKIGIYLLRYFMVLKEPLFIYQTILFACGLGAFFTFIGISSYLFIDTLKISPIIYSYIYILLAAGYLGGNYYLQCLNKKRLSYAAILGNGSCITLIGASLMILAQGLSLKILIVLIIAAGAILMRFANAILNPTVQVLTVNRFKKRGGVALGMTICLGLASQGLGIVLVTFFHNEPLKGLIIVSFTLSIIGIFAFYLVKKFI